MSSPLRIAVAKANPATAARLAALGRQIFAETFAAHNTPADMAAYLDQTFSSDLQLAQLQDPATTFLLVEMQGQAVGYAQLLQDSPLGLPPGQEAARQLEIKQLYVAEDWIGTGLGGTLMRRAVELAQAAGNTALVLGVWEHNQQARAFYQRFGFKEIGETTFTLGSDVQRDLVLRKGLARR